MSGLESIRQTVDEMRLLQMEGMDYVIDLEKHKNKTVIPV